LTSFYQESGDLIFKKKCITLVADLVREEKENSTENTPLLDQFVNSGWCKIFMSELDFKDLDLLEKALKGQFVCF